MSHRSTALSKRVTIAKSALSFVGILQYDKDNKPKVFVVPGSEGKQYRVILRRGNGVVSTECHLLVGGDNTVACKGNSNGAVCKHALTAVSKATDLANLSISFCEDEKSAKRLSNVSHGRVYGVKSWQGKGEVWGVART